LGAISSILVKPACADCNLACRYCFYECTAAMYPETKRHRMNDEVLESMVSQYLALAGPRASFGWQGGEPTLMGLGFFRKAVELQCKHGTPGQVIGNGFQTNGVLIDAEWARFLAENRFLIGLSLDGPGAIHDYYRTDRGGHGSHARVLEGLAHLKAAGAEVNVLCMVTDVSVHCGGELFDYFVGLGLPWMQFIPCIEANAAGDGLQPFSLDLDFYGGFLCELFDRWYANGRPQTYIREFEELLIAVATGQAASCVHSAQCGDYVVVEHNGDVYACDFHITPEWYLGNLMETPLEEILRSPRLQEFAEAKSHLDGRCRSCPWVRICYGGCPKYRVDSHGSRAPRTCFCPAIEQVLARNYERLLSLAQRATRGRPPATPQRSSAPIGEVVERNAPCPCGSGRKYKRCCMVADG